MTDYSKVCWYCKQGKMVNKGSYYQCPACGTTWNDLPELNPSPLVKKETVRRDAGGEIITHQRHPRALRRSRTLARKGVK